MKVIKSLFILSLLFFIISCESTKVEDEIIAEETAEVVEVVVPEPTPEEIFIESLNNVKMEFTQLPKVANYNKPFSCPYTLAVTDNDGNALAGYSVTFKVPVSRNKMNIEFQTVVFTTDETGTINYEQPVLEFGINDFIYAYPTPAFESSDVINACQAKAAKAQIKAKSNIISKGCLLFIWDFNEKDRPVNNSYDILSELRSYGITMSGNAPVNEASDIGTPIEQLYKRNYEIVEDAYGYLICGSVKFVEPVSEVEDGWKCSLAAEITVVNMKNGEIQFEKTYNNENVGKNWTAATSGCKEKLAEIICEDIVFGL